MRLKGMFDIVAMKMPSAPYIASMTGKPRNTVFAKVTAKKVMPFRSAPGRSTFAVTQPSAESTTNITTKLSSTKPRSARSISISVFITEYSMVHTSSTFITMFERCLFESEFVTPSLAQTKPTIITNTSIPIWDMTSVMSILALPLDSPVVFYMCSSKVARVK